MAKAKYKYCIIGSGIAGGTIIENLVQLGEEVLLVEAGNFSRQSNPPVSLESIGLDFGLRSTRSIQVGGTSNLWHGVLSPLDRIDFEQRSWVQNSGWPICYDDLLPFYIRAAKDLGVENPSYYNLAELPKELKDLLAELSFNRDVLENKIFQQPIPPKNFKDSIYKLWKKKSNFTLLENTSALQLIRTDDKITSLKVGLENGETREISADTFILCAGALETPRLLLNSGIENKNIGKYLMDHPMGNLCQVELKRPRRAHIYSALKITPDCALKSGITLSDKSQKDYQVLNHNFYFRPSFKKGINNTSEKVKLSLLAFKDGKVSFRDILYLFCNMNVVLQVLAYKLSYNAKYKYADLFFVTEQAPNPESSVSLSQNLDKWGFPIAKVNWVLTDQEVESMDTWYNIVRSNLNKEDYDFVHEPKDIKWKGVFTSAAHHVGTARMAESAEHGVVDKNLKSFDLENLYICDGSVFPTSGNVNNGFTIAALAIRLVDHLKDKS